MAGNDIHIILASFAPAAISLLEKAGFFRGRALTPAFWARFKALSLQKNTEVWQIVSDLYSRPGLEEGQAMVAGQLRIEKTAITEATPWVKAYFKKREKEFIRLTTRTDMTRFRPLVDAEAKAIFDAVVKNPGLHEKVFAQKLKNSYIADGDQARLRNIKRTESHNAASGGGWGFAQASGAKTHTRHEVGDKRTRPSHRVMMGETKPIDEPYSNGEMYPGEKDINCRGWETFSF